MAKDKEKQEQEKQPKLVKMVREGPPPNTADVHPAEVTNYMLGGWQPAPEEKAGGAQE